MKFIFKMLFIFYYKIYQFKIAHKRNEFDMADLSAIGLISISIYLFELSLYYSLLKFSILKFKLNLIIMGLSFTPFPFYLFYLFLVNKKWSENYINEIENYNSKENIKYNIITLFYFVFIFSFFLYTIFTYKH